MADFEVAYSLDNATQFWAEVEDILSTTTPSHELIDNALRTFFAFVTTYKTEYLPHDDDVRMCIEKLVASPLCQSQHEYVRRQIMFGLLQEDELPPIHFLATFLLLDGRTNSETFEDINDEGGFGRLVHLIALAREVDDQVNRVLLELMFEMARVERIRAEELALIQEDFVLALLQLIEDASDDVQDPYHYHIIRVLLVLNEQYMVSEHGRGAKDDEPLPNQVIGCLSRYGASYKTFGENIILLLNRESETTSQLLILKLLYLLFTTEATHEYFYTNDLRVLVDVMIRNLLDLPFLYTALRHTYLRVLHPLLANTQLRLPENHYKQDELLKLIQLMGCHSVGVNHFESIDETTRRLVLRCQEVEWLHEGAQPSPSPRSPLMSGFLTPPPGASPKIGVNGRAASSAVSIAEMKAPPPVPAPRRIGKMKK